MCARKTEKETDCEDTQGSQCETPVCTVTLLLFMDIRLFNNKACVSVDSVYLVLVYKISVLLCNTESSLLYSSEVMFVRLTLDP